MIRRKPIEDDDDSPDRWLVSYADFITLLFAFFVVMYAISSVNLSKYNALTTSMGSAFTGKELNQPNAVSKPNIRPQNQAQKTMIKPLPLSYLYQERAKRERENMAQMGLELANKLSPLIQEDKIRVIQNQRGVRIDIKDSLLFNSGAAELASSAQVVLSEIANLLKSNQRLIQIEGHTDNTPIHNEVFYSNWELSAVRATTVVRLLIEQGLEASRLSAVGYGDTQPISTGDNEYAQASNRRVSVMILYDIKNDEKTPENVEIKPSLDAAT